MEENKAAKQRKQKAAKIKKANRKTTKTKKRQNCGKTTFKGGVEDDDVEKDDGKRKMDERTGIGSLGFNNFGSDRLRWQKGGTGEQFYGRI